jgi:beta-glucosidase
MARWPTISPVACHFAGPTPPCRGRHAYPLGYGLSAKTAAAPWQPLPEQSGVDDSAGSTTEYFQKGVPTPGWSLEIQNAGTGGITRITSVPASVADSGVTISATDYQVQEGARTFAFSGTKGEAALALTTHAPDLSRETNGEMMLVATLRVDSAPTARSALACAAPARPRACPWASWTCCHAAPGPRWACRCNACARPAQRWTRWKRH